MTQYHIKEDGNPGLCKAEKGNCPKGGAHFDSETEARAAVEQLFGSAFRKTPEPLAVYTKTAIKEQFGRVWDIHSNSKSPAYGRSDAYHYGDTYVREVFDLLTESRLDVKSQNLKVREAVEAKISSMSEARAKGTDNDKIAVASAFEYLSPILSEHYGFEDPRTEAQRTADRDFVENYQHEYDAVPAYSMGNKLVELSDEDLKKLASFQQKKGSDVSDEDLVLIHSLNPQSQTPTSRWFEDNENMDSLEYYQAMKEKLAKSATVPEDMQQYLVTKMQKEQILQQMDSARNEILYVAPRASGGSGNRMYDSATHIGEIASDILDIRAENRAVRAAVLEA